MGLAIYNGVGWEEGTKELNFERECRGELLSCSPQGSSPALLTASDESFSSVIFSIWIAACILSPKPTWFCFFPVLGFGMDPDLQMDIITELDLVNTTLGVTQVAGLHNASKAFLFHGKKHISFFSWGRGRGGWVWGVLRFLCLGNYLYCFSCVVLLKYVINRGYSESGMRQEGMWWKDTQLTAKCSPEDCVCVWNL